MKNILFATFIALSVLSCGAENHPIEKIDPIGGTRASMLSAAEQEALAIQNELGFLANSFNDGQKSSNLGNGKYYNYLKVTFRLTNKPLYQQEILEARQVCLREMMHTHYAYSKEEVIDELAKILAGDMLLETEKKQVSVFLEKIVAGVYQNAAIQFECKEAGNCIS